VFEVMARAHIGIKYVCLSYLYMIPTELTLR